MKPRPTVCVVGLGYVGLPLAHGFAKAGYAVIGYDIDSARIDAHPIDSPPAMAWSGAGCNTALMSLQYAMQTAGRPLLFVASHPMGNLVVLYLKPRFSH